MDLIYPEKRASCVTTPDRRGLGSYCILLPECSIPGILAGSVETFVGK